MPHSEALLTVTQTIIQQSTFFCAIRLLPDLRFFSFTCTNSAVFPSFRSSKSLHLNPKEMTVSLRDEEEV